MRKITCLVNFINTSNEYHGEMIVTNRIYTVNDQSEESWVLMEDRNYTYSGNNLVSVKGDGYSLDRNYSDARTLSLNLNGEITSYDIE